MLVCKNLNLDRKEILTWFNRFADRDMFMRFRGGGVGHGIIRMLPTLTADNNEDMEVDESTSHSKYRSTSEDSDNDSDEEEEESDGYETCDDQEDLGPEDGVNGGVDGDIEEGYGSL